MVNLYAMCEGDKCGKNFRIHGMVVFKGVRLCKICYLRRSKRIERCGQNAVKLEDGLKKIRIVRSYISKKKGIEICVMSLPMCFKGKRVRVVLVDDEEVKDGS